MTDVLEIAKARRSKLSDELAKLDDFIETAEMLLRYGQIPSLEGKRTPEADSPDINAVTDWLGGVKEGESQQGSDPVTTQPLPSNQAVGAPNRVPESVAGTSIAHEQGVRERHIFSHGPREQTIGSAADEFMFAEDEDELVLTHKFPQQEIPLDASVVGRKIRHRRWNAGITKNKLAGQLGISVDELRDYEDGKGYIAAALVSRLAASLNVPTSYFYESAEHAAARDAKSEASNHFVTDNTPRGEEYTLARTA